MFHAQNLMQGTGLVSRSAARFVFLRVQALHPCLILEPESENLELDFLIMITLVTFSKFDGF